MTLPSLVSFSGYSRAGKSSAADVLVSRARFVKTYMSKPLEQALLTINPWIVDYSVNTIERFGDLHESLGYEGAKDNFEEVYRLLKTLSTDFGRNTIGENIWIDQVFEEIEGLKSLNRNIALSGVRYPYEAALVRKHEGVCVWIDRPGAHPVNTNGTSGMLTAEDCDVVVMNNGTLKDLYVNIVIALEEYTAEQNVKNDTDRLI